MQVVEYDSYYVREPDPTLVARQPLNGHLIRDVIDGWLASVSSTLQLHVSALFTVIGLIKTE